MQCQVDFGETVLLTEYGERRKVYCIGFVLAHSRYKYIEWLDRPFRTVDVIRMHENAFRFYDGMPEEIVYDQDKLLTVSENAGDLLLTEQFKSYRDYRGFRVHLCRKADPESKGKIESVIKFVKYNFSKNRTFVDLEKLNQQTVEWLKRTGNRKVHQTIKKRPFKVFALEKQHLKSLSTSYILSPSSDMKIISRNVQKDNTIRFEGNRYSVPAGTYHPRTANRVFLDINESRLRIRLEPDGNTIADHPLSGGKGHLITDPSHKRKSGTKTARLSQEVQQLFQNHELIKWYLKELRAKYPRHLIDQLVVMKHAIHQHPEFADEALRLAKMYNLISANDYRDILFSLHKESESKEIKAAENTQTKYSHLQASERDVSYYVGLLEGDSQ
ncbi:Mu transposase domain-containing protein [Sporosarcina luteola]|uniref:Mu transposase domain-containing protein n=1 Tax=Sporosarcina luteola TaxID=582850 RepID=UPI00203BABB0|nr:DDE-type integrase/transposase/recombinase [Sporosarcina luteola]